MSTQRKAEFTEAALSEDAVHDYLMDNPDFFERHSDLLGTIRLPHGAGGAVSLRGAWAAAAATRALESP